MNPGVWETVSNTKEGSGKNYRITFTSATPEQTTAVDYPQNHPDFWTHQSVLCVSSVLLVRRFHGGNGDTVFLRRLNANGTNTNFKFPSTLIPAFVESIEKILSRQKRDENNLLRLEGLEEEANLTDEGFWNSPETFKIAHLWIRPYRGPFGIQVRFWQEIEEKFHREVTDSGGNLKKWKGPSSSISFKALEDLRLVLRCLQSRNPLAAQN